MTRTALFLASLLSLNGSLAAALMPTAECAAEKICVLELRLLAPPPPNPAPPVTPALAADADADPVQPLRRSPGGAQ